MQNGRLDRQGTPPLELLPLVSITKQPPICPSSCPSTTSGGQNSYTASTTDNQTFGLGTPKRYKRFSTRQEKARTRNPCTKQAHNPSLRSHIVIEHQMRVKSMSQVAIVLSTGKLNGTQIFSLITSVISLSWGAARSFLILRPADKADPDPELMTVSLRIWPYVLDLVCSRSTRLERDLANFLRLFSTFFCLDQTFCLKVFFQIFPQLFTSSYLFEFVHFLYFLFSIMLLDFGNLRTQVEGS